MRAFLSFFLTTALMVSVSFVPSASSLEAASRRTVSFDETISVAELKASYAGAVAGGEKVRILIMPGHEPGFGGTEFMGYYERELVVDIAQRLATELRTDPSFEVLVARGGEGWNSDFTYYFDRQERKIERFVEEHKEAMAKLEKRGKLMENEGQTPHNEARSDVALRLYGINKWANENEVDLVLHVHLNDETGHAPNVRGVHAGAAIYVPDSIFGNAKASKAIAEPVWARLMSTNATSTVGYEKAGIVEDRDLIAIGANNTSEVPSLLIEYGYIYEPRISGEGARHEVFADYAYQTALGVKDFFGSPSNARFSTKVLPYQFSSDLLATTTASTTPVDARGVYALQASLRSLGFYPGTEASLTECPVSGMLNECTSLALQRYQASEGIEQTGTLGPQTRVALNRAFGLSTPLASVPTPAVPAACPQFTHPLEPKQTDADTDGDVTRLQSFLARDAMVYPEGSVTGYFGPATLAAVQRFQVKYGVVVQDAPGYGLVGPATKAALGTACSTAAN